MKLFQNMSFIRKIPTQKLKDLKWISLNHTVGLFCQGVYVLVWQQVTSASVELAQRAPPGCKSTAAMLYLWNTHTYEHRITLW